MFELHDVSLLAAALPQERVLLGDVSAVFPPGEVVALVGPPGSGKSLLLQVLAGVRVPTFGEVLWAGPTPAPSVAYHPALNFGHDRAASWLTVREQVSGALRLRVAASAADRAAQADALLCRVELAEVGERLGGTLSRGQRRRLELALELAGSPGLLLWDERDDAGSDPGFERLLRTVAGELRIAIVRVTEALDRLGDFDSVLVLCGGHLAYHGVPGTLAHYFQIEEPGALWAQLASRDGGQWHGSWEKHGEAYRRALPAGAESGAPARLGPPGAFRQGLGLLRRRCKVLLRDRAELGRELTLALAFPLAAAVFAMDGLPRFVGLSGALRGDVAAQVRENALLAVDATYGVGLVNGLVLAQFVLLAFLTGRLASNEVAGERGFLEREKFRGLRVGAYVASKAAFLLPWVVLQALWMGVFIHEVCRMPGALGWQAGVLALANAAFAAMCLALSSFARTPGRARQLCFGLAALQLPFAGVLLAPPEWLSWTLRPLSPLYWGSGAYFQSMEGTRFYEILQMVNPQSPSGLCLGMLGGQLALGLIFCAVGCNMNRLRVAPGREGT
ncbi:MAG: ATP-binding cassette domain-containing protein [Chthoniobacteraceae bacterium]